jgi:hypothetical protein
MNIKNSTGIYPLWGGDRFVTRKNFAFLAGRCGAVEFAPFLLKNSFCEFCAENY